MTEDKIDCFDVSREVPADEIETRKISNKHIVVECFVHYRGKSNSYVKERRSIAMIVDKHNRVVEGKWEKDFTEVTQGIETCKRDVGTRYGRIEQYKTETVRIKCEASPVYIQFQESYEYVDYDGYYNQSNSKRYWVRYES